VVGAVSRHRPFATQRVSLIVAVAIALTGCGGDDAGRVVRTDDTTPPSKLTMDAHVPQPDGQVTIVTVNPNSGDQSVTLMRLPAITLLAQAEDAESAISDLRIEGETTVSCIGPELGQDKHASWLKTLPASTEPRFSPLISLAGKLGRQSPTDLPGPDFIAHCPPDKKLTAVSGEFWASETNGVDQSLRTGRFHFGWTRPA
jgi:hypothetical protein